MRRAMVVLMTVGLLLVGVVPAVAQTQPSRGDHSIDRNEAGVGGGPHCHTLAVDQARQERFDHIWVFPSHRAHEATGLPNAIFAGDGNCDGQPG